MARTRVPSAKAKGPAACGLPRSAGSGSRRTISLKNGIFAGERKQENSSPPRVRPARQDWRRRRADRRRTSRRGAKQANLALRRDRVAIRRHRQARTATLARCAARPRAASINCGATSTPSHRASGLLRAMASDNSPAPQPISSTCGRIRNGAGRQAIVRSARRSCDQSGAILRPSWLPTLPCHSLLSIMPRPLLPDTG